MEKKPFYQYSDPEILKEVENFESQLPDNPEELLKLRKELELKDNEAVGDYKKAKNLSVAAKTRGERSEASIPKKKTQDEYHKNLDKIHAINRKLNELNYKE